MRSDSHNEHSSNADHIPGAGDTQMSKAGSVPLGAAGSKKNKCAPINKYDVMMRAGRTQRRCDWPCKGMGAASEASQRK